MLEPTNYETDYRTLSVTQRDELDYRLTGELTPVAAVRMPRIDS